jgi:hypothetical protein
MGLRVVPFHCPMPAGGCSCGVATCDVGKHPRISDPARSASTDPATLKDWWRRWPDANVGIATGAGSNAVVLDVDPDRGGEATLQRLQREHGPLPRTPEDKTGTGFHLWFRHPGPGCVVPSRTDGLGPGLDVRGDRGLVVAPPSLHQSGCLYEWKGRLGIDQIKMPPLPEWVREAVSEPAVRAIETTESRDSRSHPPCSAVSVVSAISVASAIKTTLPRGERERNNCIWLLARALRAVPELAGAELPALRPVVKQWHEAALPVIRTKAFTQTWSDFIHAWDRVMFPMGVGLAEIVRRAASSPAPPEAALYEDAPDVRRLVCVCHEAQRATGTGTFFLSCHQAGEILHVDPSTAWRWLRMLVADGVLVVTQKGTQGPRGKATRYKYVGVRRGGSESR